MEVVFKVDSSNLFEQQLFDFLKQQKQELEEVSVEALNSFLNSFQKKDKFDFKKRDPKKYIRKIEYVDEDEEDLSDVTPYAHVEDSAKYIHDLRREKR